MTSPVFVMTSRVPLFSCAVSLSTKRVLKLRHCFEGFAMDLNDGRVFGRGTFYDVIFRCPGLAGILSRELRSRVLLDGLGQIFLPARTTWDLLGPCLSASCCSENRPVR